MPYFDNAATSWPKPDIVYKTMDQHFRQFGGSPGRSGHALAVAAEHQIEEVRNRLSKFFNAESPERIVFTMNATDALNIAIKGMLGPGDHVISSMLEHNSVTRPLAGMVEAGTIELDRISCGRDTRLNPDDLIPLIRPNTKLIALTHCSNVTGTLQPIQEFAKIARDHRIPLLVDGSQTAGIVPIDFQAMNIDLFAAPGHKSLLGPTGTGMLYVRPGLALKPFREGGTGSDSEQITQPLDMPFRLEGGTPNTLGIAGLGAAIKFLQGEDLENRLAHERSLAIHFAEACAKLPNVEVHGSTEHTHRLGTVSISIATMEPSDVSAILDQSFQISVRSGLHCAPLAHQVLGTSPKGTVRFSFGIFNTDSEIDLAIQAIREIAASLS